MSTQRNIRYDDDVTNIVNAYIAAQESNGRKISFTIAVNELLRAHGEIESISKETLSLTKTLLTDVATYLKESISREVGTIEKRMGIKLHPDKLEK